MIESYITRPTVFPMEAEEPWRIVENLCENITHLIEILDDEFDVKDGVAIHQSAIIGHNVTIKAPAIISGINTNFHVMTINSWCITWQFV